MVRSPMSPREPLALARTELERSSLLSCVHCGLCLSACPTYRVLKSEPDSPRGRIYLMRALEEGRLEPDADVLQHFSLCLNCRACETACPAGVHYGDLIERTRARLRESGHSTPAGRLTGWLLERLFHPWERVEAAAEGLSWAERLGLLRLARTRPVRALLPPALRAATQLLPPVPSAAERAVPVGVHPPYPGGAAPRARVGLLVTCVVQPLYPNVNRSLLHLLRVAGCEVVVPAAQACCGALQVHAGLRDQARRQARAVIDAMPADLDFVAVASAGCGATLKEYGELFAESAGEDRERARALAARVKDGLELLAELGLPAPPRRVSERVAVHDPCHLAHAQRVREAPRRLLRQIPGAEVKDLAHSDWCCGSAGIYNLQHPEMAETLLEQKLETVRDADPTVVAVANPGCLLHMEAGARRRGMSVRFRHPLEILADAYSPPATGRGHA
jgi:glycolate oxidase iron-sulfur subunit